MKMVISSTIPQGTTINTEQDGGASPLECEFSAKTDSQASMRTVWVPSLDC
jgi:hypothetical protein